MQKVKDFEHKGLDLWSEFPWFDNEEVTRVILSQLQNDNIVLDKPYLISKDIISAITHLCDKGTILIKKSLKNKEVKNLTNVMGDQRALLIDKIVNPMVRYVAYGISHKIYFRNREGSTSTIIVYVAHMLVMEDRVFYLCELLKNQLLENIKMTKKQGYLFGLDFFLYAWLCLVWDHYRLIQRRGISKFQTKLFIRFSQNKDYKYD